MVCAHLLILLVYTECSVAFQNKDITQVPSLLHYFTPLSSIHSLLRTYTLSSLPLFSFSCIHFALLAVVILNIHTLERS